MSIYSTPQTLTPKPIKNISDTKNSVTKDYAGKGFYEDTANPSIWQAYFLGYSNVSENVHPMQRLLTGSEVVKAWTQGEGNIKKKEITHACIQADTKSLVFIGGVKKK